jgi:uracil-DNA glycosylase
MLTNAEKKLRDTLGYSWFRKIGKLFIQPEMKKVAKFVTKRRKAFGVKVYPSKEDTFRAFRLTSFQDTKVVIIGLDPDCTPDVADGLAFSTHDPYYVSPSLEGILKEVETSVHDGLELIRERDLTRWALQGVLLLNTVLTVEKGKPLSHEKIGWQWFTLRVIRKLVLDEEPKVFLLWGMAAKSAYLQATHGLDAPTPHLVLEAAHPEAESVSLHEEAGFFGCDHFATANKFLKETGQREITW